MIAQIRLSLLLCAVFLYAWIEYRRSPVVAFLSSVASLAGLYFVWVPSDSTRLAAFVGIGRGVDLILYTWVGISLIIILNLHLKLRTHLELITVLARTIALANPAAVPAEMAAPMPLDVSAARRSAAGRRSRRRGDQNA
jgi:small membrane protein